MNNGILRPHAFVSTKNIGHTALNVLHSEEMWHFYCELLGFSPLFSLSVGDLASILRGRSELMSSPELRTALARMEADPDRPWLTYLKREDRQFIETFEDWLGAGFRVIEDRSTVYGNLECAYRVKSLAAVRARLDAAGIPFAVAACPTCGETLRVKDPDGNTVILSGQATVITYQVQNPAAMTDFYVNGLDLKLVGEETLPDGTGMLLIGAAKDQYLKFLVPKDKKQEERDLNQVCGYAHLCLETDDIRGAFAAVQANGIVPDTPLSLGPDQTWQFWVVDPDGNRLEYHQYTENAYQLR